LIRELRRGIELKLMARYLLAAFGSLVAGFVVISLVLLLRGQLWFVALALGAIWAVCLEFLAWGVAYVLWPLPTARFQERLRTSYGAPFADFGRQFDRRLGLGVSGDEPSTNKARLEGVAIIALMVTVGVVASWILLASFQR
jgi:hypothetical protein